MKLLEVIKNNAKLYMILSIIILLGVIGSSLAVLASNFNAINVNTSMLEIDADISYDENSSGEEIVSNGNMLPISDSLVTGPNVTDSRVLKATFNVTGSSNNPEDSIYDIALHNVEVDCALRTKDLKWRLYKNNELISREDASLSPTFDTMNNNRLVLTETQEDLTTSTDKYTFLLWISESCTGDISECTSAQDQSKYLGKEFSASIKIELSTKSKKTINRITGSEESCYYTEVDIPMCNTLTYNGLEQELISVNDTSVTGINNTLETKILPLGTKLLANNLYYSLINNKGVNAGDYLVTLKLNEGYKWTDGSTNDRCITCRIDKKDLTITTLDQTTTYGNKISSSTADVSINGLLENNTLNKVYLTSSTVDVGTGKISTNTVEIIDNSNKDVTSNYNVTKNNTGVVTINCANIAVEPNVGNVLYTGEEVTGVSGGSYITVLGNKVGTETGSYNITVVPNKNYCWSDGTTTEKEYIWNIEIAKYEIVLDNKNATKEGTTKIYGKDTYGIYLDNEYKNKMTSTTNKITLPTKEGNTFKGYYTEENGNGTLVINTDGYLVSNISNSVKTLYAYWDVNEYNITFDYQNNIYSNDVSTWEYNGNSKINNTYSYSNTIGVEVYSDNSLYTGIRIPITSDKKKNANYRLSVTAYRTGNFDGLLRAYATAYDSSGNVINYNHGISFSTDNLPLNTWKTLSYWFNSDNYSTWNLIYIDFDVANQGPVYVSNIELNEYVTNKMKYGSSLELPTPIRSGYTFDGWYTEPNGGGTRISSSTTVPAGDVAYYANWIDNINPTISSVTASTMFDRKNYVTFTASDLGSGVSYYNITSDASQPTNWIPVTSYVESDTETQYKYNTSWARVFHHNSHHGEFIYSSLDEAKQINTFNKYSVLNNLEKYRTSEGYFEFLLDYPELGGYNRWKQTANPVTTTISDGASTDSLNYTPISISYEPEFTGLAISTRKDSTLLDGMVGNSYWCFSIGSIYNYHGGFPGPYETGQIVSIADLWSKIDENNRISKSSITGRIGGIDNNGTYYLWIKDNNGNVSSKSVSVNKIDKINPNVGVYSGSILYQDPEFASGTNGTSIYNNLGNGNVTVTRKAISGIPNNTGYGLEIVTKGSASPSFGGFYFETPSSANKEYITRIVAKIPVGYNIEWASNAVGDNPSQGWLTSQSGTGDWEEYVFRIKCGSTGSFVNTNYFYLSGAGGPAASETSPLVWQVAYATVIDTTKYGKNNLIVSVGNDSSSGIASYQFTSDGSKPMSWLSTNNKKNVSNIKEVTSNGTYYAWYKDVSGNINNARVDVTMVDNTKPTVATYAGTVLYTDPEFSTGYNGANTYHFSSSATTTMTRKQISGIPNSSGYGLEIVTKYTDWDGYGGFYFATPSSANKEYISRIIAKIPVGYTLEFRTNPIGDNDTRIWLTSNKGTGDWEEYVFRVKCGSTGSFHGTNYFNIHSSEVSSNVTWYVAYATVIDTTIYGKSNLVVAGGYDNESGIVAYQITDNGTTPTSWININNTQNTSVIKEVSSNGAKYVWFKDASGNINTSGVNVTMVDNVVPTVKSYAGKILNNDPEFSSGMNGIGTYTWTGNVNITRKAISGVPNSTGYGLEITSTEGASPGKGGFYFATQTAANKELITRIVAKIPVGYYINWTSNANGDNTEGGWLTSQDGTGQWEEYIFRIKCGPTGTFSTTNFFYLDGGSFPVTWQVSYATVIDATNSTKDYIIAVANDNQSGVNGWAITNSSSVPSSWNSAITDGYVGVAKTLTSNETYYSWFKDAVGNASYASNTINNTYTVSYNANGGSGAPSSQTKTYNIALTLSSTVPTRTGYTFLGWSTNSSATSATYSAGGSYTSNSGATLYAVWKINTYTVTQYHYYYYQNADWTYFNTTTNSVNYGSSFTPYNVTPQTGYYAGNNYGYYDSAGTYLGSGTVGSNSFTVTENMRVHVHYYPNSYTVSYNANGGSGAPSSQTKYYATPLTLSSTVPTRSGYTFLGWSTSSSATSATYSVGGSYTANESTTLYAVWKINISQTASASAVSGLRARNYAQTGVSGQDVDWSGTTSATFAGTYTAYATPKANYAWPGGGTETRTITWSIGLVTKGEWVYLRRDGPYGGVNFDTGGTFASWVYSTSMYVKAIGNDGSYALARSASDSTIGWVYPIDLVLA